MEDKQVFTVKIPVGNMSPKDLEILLREIRKKYKTRDFVLEERRKKLDKIMGKINEK